MKSGARGGTPGPRSAAADVDAASSFCVNIAASSALFCSKSGADEKVGFVFLLPGRQDKAPLMKSGARGGTPARAPPLPLLTQPRLSA